MRFFLLLFLFLFQSNAHAGDFIVIVNKDGPLVGADMELVREVYLGEKKFANSTRILTVNFTEGPIKDAFIKTVVGMSPKEYKHHSLKKVFQGELSILVMGSPVDIIEFVAREKGAVAYLPALWTETILFGTSGNAGKTHLPLKAAKKIEIIGP